jgi:ABC-type protease/lipase transport system fused ATPase/permease subunit
MAFLHGPELVLLDEPRTSLDSDGSTALGAAVAGHTARGGGVIWCSPIGEPIGYEVDRSLLMRDGVLRPG